MGCHTMLIRLFVAVYLACFLPYGHCCEEGWASYSNMCYKVFRIKTTQIVSMLYCDSEAAQLASISTEGKLLFLSKLISYTPEQDVWVGLTKRRNNFNWLDGTSVLHQSYVPQDPPKEGYACGVFNGAKVVWVKCYYLYSFICQRQAFTHTYHQNCMSNAFAAKRSNYCIWVPQNQTDVTWSSAGQVCSLDGSHMASLEEIFHESVQHFRGHVEDKVNYWLSTKWEHLNSTHFEAFSGAFNSNGTGSCMTISFSFSDYFNFLITKIDCEEKANVICFSVAQNSLNATDLDVVTTSSSSPSSIAAPIHTTSVSTTTDITTTLEVPAITTTPEVPAITTTTEVPAITATTEVPDVTTTTEVTDITVESTEAFPSRSHISGLSCPHGYNWKEDTASGFCFWETSYETSKLSWADARAYCQRYGGDLASFHSRSQEQIGLSFQYRLAAHPYWIGLSYDRSTDSYSWSDGSPLNYSNWGPAQTSPSQKYKNCVQMDPSKVHWVLSYCGELCWFICKAPKQLNPVKPILPTPPPLVSCLGDDGSVPYLYRTLTFNKYFEGYCYEIIGRTSTWSEAKEYCISKEANLVSVHSEREANFLIRLMNPRETRDLNGNRLWIGLNSNGFDGQFIWSDGSPYDFKFWDDNEPNNMGDEEHCVNMYLTSAFWNDESCHSEMPFICKKCYNCTNEPSATEATIEGNCPEGWYTFSNRCFKVIGDKEQEREDFVNASLRCRSEGGFLASVRNFKEQAFMAFLIQSLKSDMWIGLSDRVSEGHYQWLDNSPMFYTNWVQGGPEAFDPSDCVFLNYNSSVSGMWRSSHCDQKLPFICQKTKDTSITEQAQPKALHCIYPPGWLKQDGSCYMLSINESSYEEAKLTCEYYHGNLVSISDTSVEAVVNYLSAGSDKSYWIGLLVNHKKFLWANGRPLSISRWDANQPQAAAANENSCFIVTSDGVWSHKNCSEKLPFICQVTSGNPPPPKSQKGSCPSDEWADVDAGDENCYLFDSTFLSSSWSSANFQCYSKGGNLVSFHSMLQVFNIKRYLSKSEHLWGTAFYTGLVKNKNGGFLWSDLTPVDFVNWAEGEPQDPSLKCVHINPDTMLWATTSCFSAKHFICSIKKVINESLSNSSEKLIHEIPESQVSGISGGVVAAIILVIIFVVLISATAVVMYFYPNKISWRRLQSERVTSFENALYKTELVVENPDMKTLYIHD